MPRAPLFVQVSDEEVANFAGLGASHARGSRAATAIALRRMVDMVRPLLTTLEGQIVGGLCPPHPILPW